MIFVQWTTSALCFEKPSPSPSHTSIAKFCDLNESIWGLRRLVSPTIVLSMFHCILPCSPKCCPSMKSETRSYKIKANSLEVEWAKPCLVLLAHWKSPYLIDVDVGFWTFNLVCFLSIAANLRINVICMINI